MSQAFAHSQDALRAIAQAVLDHAKARGATACEVDVSEGLGQSVSVRRQEVETIEYNRDKGLGVTVYIGQRRGHASSSDFSLPALRASVEAALSIARFTAEDDCAGLPEAKLLAKRDMDLDLFHPWDISVESAIDLARRCEQAAFDVSPLFRHRPRISFPPTASASWAASPLHAITCRVRSSPARAMKCSVTTGMRRGAMPPTFPMRR
jgi:PmbA protein